MSAPLPQPIRDLIERAQAIDGQPPFSEQTLVEAARGERRVFLRDETAVAILGRSADGPEFELVVDPDVRGKGIGGSLVADVLDASADSDPARELFAWAHGDHPAAHALAERHGFVPIRTLLQLRADLGTTDGRVLGGTGGGSLRIFRPGIDDAAWLELNAQAFADHPEQGRLTQRDLDDRKNEAWFDPAVFFLLENSDGELVGFNWLKIEDGIGEIYAIAVAPDSAGKGIGRTLLDAGLTALTERGIRTAALYVEADNLPALALYRAHGFEQYSIDVRYRRTASR